MLNPEELAFVKQTRSADVSRLNTSIEDEISDDVYHVHLAGK